MQIINNSLIVTRFCHHHRPQKTQNHYYYSSGDVSAWLAIKEPSEACKNM